MKKYILFSLIFLISFKLVQSQNYFPLHVGDKFIYFYYYNQWWTGGGTSGSYKTIMKIKKDSIINNKKYFYCEGFPTGIGNVFIRLDSISKNLLRFDSSNSCSYYNYEKLIDSLKMDSIYCYENACSNWFLFSKGIDTLFGQASNFKFFTSGSTIPNYVREFKANFGLIRFEDHIFQGTFSGRDGYGNLIGCLINGIIYGDTTVSDIKEIYSELPKNFSLSQNYPNPFNPSTSIKYSVSSIRIVKLTVYNIQGKEIATLVNEKQSPGTYEVSWDGSAYPSGVYFYKLIAGDYSETKKMILLK